MNYSVEPTTLKVHASNILDRIESIYLKILRIFLLIAATVLLVVAIGWSLTSLSKILKSPDSVVVEKSTVGSEDLLTSTPTAAKTDKQTDARVDLRIQRYYYDAFIKKYFALYKAKYVPSLRVDDKRLSIGEFDDLTINSNARLEAIKRGNLDFVVDKSDLDAFLPIMRDASSSEKTARRLAAYRVAKKQPMNTQVQRTRTETRRGWDTYSTGCPGWYESPTGCAVTRRLEVPYTERVTVMRYPEGLISPNELLKTYQNTYFRLLLERREANQTEAASRRQEIIDGQLKGWAGLSKAGFIIGAFMVLMFFFLMVAIERHQRSLTLIRSSAE